MTKHKLIAFWVSFISGNINQFKALLFPLMEMRQLANKKLEVIDKRIKRDSLHLVFAKKLHKTFFAEETQLIKTTAHYIYG